MRKIRIFSSLVIMLTFISCAVSAQKLLSDSAMSSILANAQSTVGINTNYRYDISYRYSNESSPNVLLDSLTGFMESKNGRYHFRLGSTEMVSDLTYSISLFNDDHIMYLTKALSDSFAVNPVQKLTKLIETFGPVQGFVSTTKKDSVIKINFPDSGLYKSLTFYISKQNHLINKVVYLVRSEALTQDGNLDEQDGRKYDRYARVEALFTNFQINPASSTSFAASDYIHKDGNKYVGVGPYADYQIYLGSPNL